MYYMYIYTYMHVCVCVCVCVCVYLSIYLSIYIYISISLSLSDYIYIYIYIYIGTPWAKCTLSRCPFWLSSDNSLEDATDSPLENATGNPRRFLRCQFLVCNILYLTYNMFYERLAEYGWKPHRKMFGSTKLGSYCWITGLNSLAYACNTEWYGFIEVEISDSTI